MVIAAMKLKDAYSLEGFPGGSEVKASACNVGDLGSIPGSGRFPGEGNGNPLQYSCLENPMDGGAWWAAVHGVAKSRIRLSVFTFSFTFTRLVITFLPRSKRLLILWLQSPSVVILEPQKIKSASFSTVSPSICYEVMGPHAMILVF